MCEILATAPSCLELDSPVDEIGQLKIENVSPKISVVVVTYNRPDQVSHTIDSLVKQSTKPYEIIIIDDGSRVPLNLTVNFENLRIIRFANEKGLSGARNYGIKISKGDYIAFIDDDAVATHNWLEEVSKAILQGADIMGGPLVPDFKATPPDWWTISEYGGTAGVGNDKAIYGANMIISKEVFNFIGFFEPRVGRQKGKLMSHEETTLINKARPLFKEHFVPTAIVSHTVHEKRLHLKYILRWRYYDGVSIRLLEKPNISKTIDCVVCLLKNSLLFAKYALNRKERIKYLSKMAFYAGRIVQTN